MKLKHAALSLIGVFASTVALAGCGSRDSKVTTAITDCQLDAHREIVETKNQSEEKRKFALGGFSDACLKRKGFSPWTASPTVGLSPRRRMTAAVS